VGKAKVISSQIGDTIEGEPVLITRLPLDPEKLVAAMLYIASHIRDKTKFKIGKMIFLGDFAHVGKYGRPIVGGRYCAMPNGPVPSEALDLLNSILRRDVAPEFWATGIESAFDVKDEQFPQFIPKVAPNMSALSESDIEVLDSVIGQYGGWNFWELMNFTHSLPAYMKAVERGPDSRNPAIDYEDFFEQNPFVVAGTKEELLENYALSRAFPEQPLAF
jgi:uncharacterized phage-associated protein